MNEWMRKLNASWMDVTGDVQGDSNLIVNGICIDIMYIYIHIYLYFYAFYCIHKVR